MFSRVALSASFRILMRLVMPPNTKSIFFLTYSSMDMTCSREVWRIVAVSTATRAWSSGGKEEKISLAFSGFR